jgi:putative thioredoxin
MGVSVEVDSRNFTADVMEASYQRPVLVDFFAQWCGPCQVLKPMLEKLTQEYDFVLAKIDIDRNPDIAQTYGVQGVPDVRIVWQGQVHQGFVGVLPEPQLRELMAQLNLKSDLDLELETAEGTVAAGNLETAKRLFAQLMEKYPQEPKVAIAAARFLISLDKLAAAEKLLAFIDERDRGAAAKANALRELIQLKLESNQPLTQELDPSFFEAVKQTLAGHYEPALQTLLAIVSQDRKYRNDGARKAMVLIFDLLGDSHPLTKQYRKQLTLSLY